MNALVEEIEWATGLNGETLLKQLAEHGLTVAWADERSRLFEFLERHDIITTNPAARASCCGMPRDDEGFCQHREYHPIFVDGGPR